jgi:hypothetical protein
MNVAKGTIVMPTAVTELVGKSVNNPDFEDSNTDTTGTEQKWQKVLMFGW